MQISKCKIGEKCTLKRPKNENLVILVHFKKVTTRLHTYKMQLLLEGMVIINFQTYNNDVLKIPLVFLKLKPCSNKSILFCVSLLYILSLPLYKGYQFNIQFLIRFTLLIKSNF